MVVRQGDISDCMFVVKSGQVCILIDPSLTLAEGGTASASSGPKSGAAQQSSGTTTSNSTGNGCGSDSSNVADLDTKRLVQVSSHLSGKKAGRLTTCVN